jgi:hypothetical protein
MKAPFPHLLVLAFTGALAAENPDFAPAIVPLTVTDGVPVVSKFRFVPPAEPAPGPEIHAVSAVVRDLGTYRLTIARGNPSTLPDIPPPAPKKESLETPFLTKPETTSINVCLGVTIYDNSFSCLRWSDPRSKEQFEAWCAWDWELLAGVKELAGDRVRITIICLPVIIDTGRTGRFTPRKLPEPPALSPDSFLITVGSPASALGDSFLSAWQAHLKAHRSALEAALAARKKVAADAAAWRAANNPAAPRDATIWIRPHRGSRYLLEDQDGKEAVR